MDGCTARTFLFFCFISSTLGEYLFGCFSGTTPSIGCTDISSVTPTKCVNICRLNSKAFAVIKLDKCCCIDSVTGFTVKPVSDCSSQCAGDSGTSCGSSTRLSVYNAAGFAYIGCFNEASGLTVAETSTTQMSPNRCLERCQLESKIYSGLKKGRDCYCSNQRSGLSVGSGIHWCDNLCTGDPNYYCGGSNEVSLYRALGRYLGCFWDDDTNLHLTSGPHDQGRSVDQCIETCSSLGKSRAGLRNQKCYCDNNHGKYNRELESSCSTKCQDNLQESCGGSTYINIYDITKKSGSNHIMNNDADGLNATDDDFSGTCVMVPQWTLMKFTVFQGRPMSIEEVYIRTLASSGLTSCSAVEFTHTMVQRGGCEAAERCRLHADQSPDSCVFKCRCTSTVCTLALNSVRTATPINICDLNVL